MMHTSNASTFILSLARRGSSLEDFEVFERAWLGLVSVGVDCHWEG